MRKERVYRIALAKASFGTSLHVGTYAQTDGGALASALFAEISLIKLTVTCECSTYGSTWGGGSYDKHTSDTTQW